MKLKKIFLNMQRLIFKVKSVNTKKAKESGKKSFFLICAHFSYHKQRNEAFRSSYWEKIESLTNETKEQTVTEHTKKCHKLINLHILKRNEVCTLVQVWSCCKQQIWRKLKSKKYGLKRKWFKTGWERN